MESKNYHEDLSHIRTMMERSSRFISLSGLSGVVAGLAAIAGAVYVYFVFQREGIDYFDGERNVFSPSLVKELVTIGIAILVVAILSGYIFTANKSKRKGLKIWDATTRRLLVTFAIPLVTGGFFCLALLYHHLFVLIAPATLLFYGLALVSAERYTLTDIKYLGYCQIILGLISLFFLGWGLLFWTIGFGALHIVYGLIMHKKYR
jgi:predicted lysophospholipase L1 biosynthesis ABC-type transport system permease subunit